MINLRQEVKPDSQLRSLELLLVIPLDKNWGAQLPSYLYEKKLIIQQAIDIEQYNNANSIWLQICKDQVCAQIEQWMSKKEWETRQSQTQDICFEVRATCSMSTSLPLEEFLLSTKDYHKSIITTRSTQDSKYTTPILQSFTQEVALNQ